MRGFFALVVGFWIAAVAGAGAQAPLSSPVSAPQRFVQLSLVADRDSVAPGERFSLGLRHVITPGWHVYWQNPGDAGLPLEVEWALPEGFSVGPFEWPTPTTYTTIAGDLRMVNYVYDREVLLPFTAQAPATVRPGEALTLSGTAYYLVCDDTTCVPEEGAVSLVLPVAASGAPSGWAAPIAEARGRVPSVWPGVTARLDASGNLSVAGGDLADLAARDALRNAYFFPLSQTAMDHNRPQEPMRGPQGVRFTVYPPYGQDAVTPPLTGVVGFDVQTPEGWRRQGLLVTAEAGAALPGVAEAPLAPGAGEEPGRGAQEAGGGGLGLPLALMFAFLGGLILNVMPCVLPILSVKALSLAHGAQAGHGRRHGVLFLFGCMTTFLALAGVLIGLQAGGAAAGWGFQLQEPLFMAALCALFFLIGLNLLGAFEVGGGAQALGAGLAGRGGDLGAFFTGVLAVTAATPCTAPFMASAMGFAAAQPPGVSLLVFAALGLGFALPFTALSFAPGLARALPKPGPWMERVKQALAFPMFATAAWAAFVMSGQTGPEGLFALLLGLVGLALLVWGWRAFAGVRGRSLIALAAAVVFAVAALSVRPPAYPQEAWSPQRVAALQAEGRTVFVNFTADWCVTCKVNEQGALSSAAFVRTLRAFDAVYLVADWTRYDPQIAQALAAHGRAGVPLYLVYPAGATEPVILPQVITSQSLAQALNPS